MKFYDLYRALPKKPVLDDTSVIEKLIEVIGHSYEYLEYAEVLDLTSMVAKKPILLLKIGKNTPAL